MLSRMTTLPANRAYSHRRVDTKPRRSELVELVQRRLGCKLAIAVLPNKDAMATDTAETFNTAHTLASN